MKWLVVSPPAIEPALPPLGALAVRSALRDKGGLADFLDLNLKFHQWFLTQSRRECEQVHVPHHIKIDPLLLSGFDDEELISKALTGITGKGDLDFGRAVRLLGVLYRSRSAAWYPRQVTLSGGVVPGYGGDPDRLTRSAVDPDDPVVACMQELAPAIAADYDVVMISIGFESQATAALALAAVLRAEFGTRVIIGGAVVNLWGERLSRYPDIVATADLFYRGRIESGIDQLLAYGQQALDIASVPGVTAIDRGQLIVTEPAGVQENKRLQRIDMSDLPEYWLPEPVLPVDWGRGCYWGSCRFCGIHAADPALGDQCRPDMTATIDQIRHIRGQGVRRIVLTNESVHPDDVITFYREWMREPIDVELCCRARPERDFIGLTTMMRATGFKLVAFGFESGSPRILSSMNKGTSVDDYLFIVDAFAAAGVEVIGHFMIGYPGETEFEAEQTVRFIERCHGAMRSAVVSRFQLHVGSPLYESRSECCVPDRDPGLAITVGHHTETGMNAEQVMNMWTAARMRVRELYPDPLLGNPLLLDIDQPERMDYSQKMITVNNSVVGITGGGGSWHRWQSGEVIPDGGVTLALDVDSYRRVTIAGWAGSIVRAAARGPITTDALIAVGVQNGASTDQSRRAIDMLVQERILITTGEVDV